MLLAGLVLLIPATSRTFPILVVICPETAVPACSLELAA